MRSVTNEVTANAVIANASPAPIEKPTLKV